MADVFSKPEMVV